jgi:predicted negative regulator of RcsB-dependent stress response
MTARSSTGGRRTRGPRPSTEDALVVGVVRVADWAQRHQRGVILGVLAAIALGAGLVYYRVYRRNLTARASTQLEQLETEIASRGTPADAAGRLRDFLNRFGGTPSADDARLLLARIQLDQNQPQDALQALDPLSGRPLDHPVGYAAARLRADAYAAAGDRDRAMGVLEGAAREARFGFQRDDAAAELADLLVRSGSYDSAAAIYRRLSQDSAAAVGGDNPYALRLGEVLALKAAGAPPPAGPPVDTVASDTTSGAPTSPAGGLKLPGAPAAAGSTAARPDSQGG